MNNNKDTDKQFCPICHIEVQPFPRYPNYVCKACYAKAADKDGRPLEFSNIDFWGGYQAIYADNQDIYDDHVCYIDGIKCWADEARFGGIVIEKQII